ncbi:SMP-30/gluconolactonase/LRE family protein [Christiangramia salexigens]|nr:SMP-30/gluconolactonase/LRE family protein [Christiangramia salexigens]
MKIKYFFQVLAFLIFSPMVSQEMSSPKLIAEVEGLAHCESVVYDSKRDLYYVSVMADRKEGDGKIATVSTNGVIKDLNFVTGLNNPKGIALKGNSLYVSDEVVLLEIDMDSGEILNEFKGYGAKSLNDVAVDKKGNVFVSDMGNSSIYKLDTKGNFKEWLKSSELQTPNGLLAVNKDLYVAGWASDATKGSDEPKGGFIKLSTTGKEVVKLTNELGNLDGIQKFDDNSFLVSAWNSGEIYKISKEGKVELVMKAQRSVGDILYIPEKKVLALPMNIQNKLMIYEY